MESLVTTYKKTVIPALMKDLKIDNIMATPRLLKLVINCGLGEALTDKKAIEKMSAQLATITGQKPVVTRAKKDISSFKLRAGDAVGLKVTLREKRMYDFLTRLITIALPRVRDFRGVPARGFDGRGSYTMGISEITIFPDLEYGEVDKVRGFEVTFVTSALSAVATKRFMELLGIPFEKGK